jgi:4-hydroxy-tetrahydrodipicolinate reductase
VHVGLGPIGQGIARMVLAQEGLQLVGATDPSPEHAGKDLGLVLGLGRKLRVKVDGAPDKFLRKTRADVAVLCTSSSLKAVRPQISALVARGLHVVSTCEELAFQVPERAALFREIGREAARRKVSVLGTGVNPGYAMDALALMLTAPCSEVRRITVTRVVDAGTRRLPLQRKVGAGLNLAQFRRAMTENSVRHVGLPESVHMIAAGLGWKLDRVDESTCASRPASRRASGSTRAASAEASRSSASTCRCTWARSPRATRSTSTGPLPSTRPYAAGSPATRPPPPSWSTASPS